MIHCTANFPSDHGSSDYCQMSSSNQASISYSLYLCVYEHLQHLLIEKCHPKCDHSLIQCDVIIAIFGSASVPHLLGPGAICWRTSLFSFFLPVSCLFCLWQKAKFNLDKCILIQQGCKLLTSSKLNGCVCTVLLLALCVF